MLADLAISCSPWLLLELTYYSRHCSPLNPPNGTLFLEGPQSTTLAAEVAVNRITGIYPFVVDFKALITTIKAGMTVRA